MNDINIHAVKDVDISKSKKGDVDGRVYYYRYIWIRSDNGDFQVRLFSDKHIKIDGVKDD